MSDLATLRSLRAGWAGPGTEAINEAAIAYYERLAAAVPGLPEPIGTDRGGVRMEWDHSLSGASCVVEYEPAPPGSQGGLRCSTYICALFQDRHLDYDLVDVSFDRVLEFLRQP